MAPEVWQAYGGKAPQAYERFLVPAIFDPWAAELIADGAPAPGERILDVACGTGVVARLAAVRVGVSGKVVGLDLNPGMLAVARSIPAPVDWREGDASRLPFPPGAFDVVFCQQGLQFFPDKPVAVREIRRVLQTAGRFALSVWRPVERSPGFLALADALSRHVSREATDLALLPFSLSDGDALRRLLEGAGFRSLTIRSVTRPVRFPSVEDFVQQYTAGSMLAPAVARASEEKRRRLADDVAAQLKDSVDSRGLSFPIESHLVIARG